MLEKNYEIEDLKNLKKPDLKRNYKTPETLLLGYLRENAPETETIDGEIQCMGGANRSTFDLFWIVKTTFPNLSFKEFVKILFGNVGRGKSICVIFCHEIEKVVFFHRRLDKPYTCWDLTLKGNVDEAYIIGDDGLSFAKLLQFTKN